MFPSVAQKPAAPSPMANCGQFIPHAFNFNSTSLQLCADSELPDEDKAARFNDAFKKLTELNSSILLKNMASITMTDGTVITDATHIKEFVDNANATVIKEIETKLMDLRTQGAVKPLKLKASEEQIKKGAPASYEVPVTFDTSNFFG